MLSYFPTAIQNCSWSRWHLILDPLLHLSPLHFATYLAFPFQLSCRYPLTGNPLLLYQFQKHPLLLILLLTRGLSLSFVTSVNFLKSTFTPSSLIFVCLAISSPSFSPVSSLNAQLPLLFSFLLTPFFLSFNLMYLSVASFLISKRLSIQFLTNLFLIYFLH